MRHQAKYMLDFQRYSGANRHTAIIYDRFISLTEEFTMQYRDMLIFESSLCQWVPFPQSSFPVILQHSIQCDGSILGNLWRTEKSGMETDFLMVGINHHNLFSYLLMVYQHSQELKLQSSNHSGQNGKLQSISRIHFLPFYVFFRFAVFQNILSYTSSHAISGIIHPILFGHLNVFPIALVEEVASYVIDTRVTHGNNSHSS